MTTLVQNLRKVRELLSDESRWAQKAFAAINNKYPVSIQNPRANCFCIIGALMRVTKGPREFTLARLALTDHLPNGYSTIPSFNDAPETTHADILKLFDKAIEACPESASAS